MKEWIENTFLVLPPEIARIDACNWRRFEERERKSDRDRERRKRE